MIYKRNLYCKGKEGETAIESVIILLSMLLQGLGGFLLEVLEIAAGILVAYFIIKKINKKKQK